ncbi:racemase [Nakamurella sp. YIM 132087]|uniref:Racemase n=1 Tax=Nakamurella alba TaxID=2665158 RepID=A0A7K1FH28_9ACTN|nr:enolase C-terminal domain-like protein [Nakamurella alba]MTD13380.1 racemase [Nakamurella alba]
MRITDVEVHRYTIPAATPFDWRDGLPGSEPAQTAAWLRITTDEGIDGIAWTLRGVIVADIVERRLRHELIGADPLRREWLWHRVWEIDRIEEMPIYALGLVDIALWDIAAKQARLPLHQFLGGYRDSLPAYASTVTYGSIEQYLDIADQCRELGYPAIKLHAWGDAKRDSALITALRDHVGDDYALMYDGSAGFDLPDAVYVGHALADAGYLWYEEPMREFNVTAHRWLADQVRVPLLVAETSDGAHMNTADFITTGCAQYVRTDAMMKGGITGALRIAHLADAFRLRAEVHGGGLAHAHLCLAIPNTTYYESLIPDVPVVREPLVGADGHVRVSDAVGIGWEEGAELPWA